ncbi:MAG: hypothetical protein M1834_002336 [Cirrosporium novae-zelandiae]|nr:MAG: hypothetical protein M1834_002336 [Cirrosporium novae-zelandiae]
MPQYKIGQSVRYKPIGGPDSNTPTSIGTIKEVITSPGVLMDRMVEASEEEPRYEIENRNTGKSAALKEACIVGLA